MSHTTRWTLEKITQRLALIQPLIYQRLSPLPYFHFRELPGPAAVPPIDGSFEDWPVIEPDTYWGKVYTDFILRASFQTPPGWEANVPTALYLPLGDAGNFSHPEALVYIDGQPYATCDRYHHEILLRPQWADGRVHDLALHGWTGMGDNWNTDKVTRLIMHPCYLAQIHSQAREFIVAARVALETARVLTTNDPTRPALLSALDEAFIRLDTREPFGEAFYASLPAALEALHAGISHAGSPMTAGVTATGHAHIDVAWLWTLDQTRRKTARTFHTVLRLMEQFPDYHFTQSQPQLYEFIRQDHPAVFDAIKSRVAEGRWEPIGGMWVEADCNLSGAESLARQFMLGRAYFKEHFGAQAESPVLWLPDVFGYAWALPQLIKQAGLEYFFTIKLGWNQYNRIPYDSFWWQGLDGTRVLTHFGTAPENTTVLYGSYNTPATPHTALYAWINLQQKELQSEAIMPFGYGDGGGGPTREMLENLQAMAHFPGLPQTRQRSAGDFFRDLEQNAGAKLPAWNGELYLEYHRGTYTTQSRNKRANRKAEFALHDAEFLASLAAQLDPAYTYPADTFTQAWRLVCLNQFHDVIPGSSVGEVYVESLAQYAEVERMAGQVRDSALADIAQKTGGDLLLVNPTSFSRSDLAFVPGASSSGWERDGQPLLAQPVEDGLLLAPGELPPYSVIPLKRSPAGLTPRTTTFDPLTLENECLRVEFSADGDITRIFDKANGREVIPTGRLANQFQAFEDRPILWDAWDIEINYDDKVWLAEPASSIERIETGPLRWILEIRRRIMNSAFTQRVSLTRSSPRLDFETVIDWHERHILLKVAFPVDVLSPAATHEIQWGSVQRPTHRNTSWDWARFETCAHKWVDLSEGGYGVSLLNDCKYGHDIQDNVLRLSLLRSPTVPDPEADQGEHRFVYSLLPHADGWEALTPAQAYALNDPMICYQPPEQALPPAVAQAKSFVRALNANIIIETIKRAEDGNGLIVRLYESQRRRGPVTLQTAFPLAKVYKCNILEENGDELPHQADQLTFPVRPFEIVTLRLVA